jgi:hypothetical protein
MVPNSAEREAAWVAVSGHFPQDVEWASRSYTQIARELFRRRDRDRLKAFADVLGTTHYGRNEVLTMVMQAGVAELDGDAEKVIGFFLNNSFNVVNNLLDPAIADFGLEITLQLKDEARRLNLTPTERSGLSDVEAHLIRKLIEIKRRDIQG